MGRDERHQHLSTKLAVFEIAERKLCNEKLTKLVQCDLIQLVDVRRPCCEYRIPTSSQTTVRLWRWSSEAFSEEVSERLREGVKMNVKR